MAASVSAGAAHRSGGSVAIRSRSNRRSPSAVSPRHQGAAWGPTAHRVEVFVAGTGALRLVQRRAARPHVESRDRISPSARVPLRVLVVLQSWYERLPESLAG